MQQVLQAEGRGFFETITPQQAAESIERNMGAWAQRLGSEEMAREVAQFLRRVQTPRRGRL